MMLRLVVEKNKEKKREKKWKYEEKEISVVLVPVVDKALFN